MKNIGFKATEKPGKEEPKKIYVKAHTKEWKPKSARDALYKDLPIRKILCKVLNEERIHYIQEVLICPECKNDYTVFF